MSDFQFASATIADLPRLADWRARPHVVEYWGDPALEPDEERLTDPRIRCWIVSEGDVPVAFVQDYDVRGWENHPFAHLPQGARGFDLFLIDADKMGQGRGTAIVAALVEKLFAEGAPAIGVDPHPDNRASIRCFEKVGFIRTSGPVDTRWGRAVLMEISPSRPREA